MIETTVQDISGAITRDLPSLSGTVDIFSGGGATANGLPAGGNTGDVLIKASSVNYQAAWVAPANSVEQDNTLPITSAAVFTEVGNINALLATI